MFMPNVGDIFEFSGHRYKFPKAPSGANMPLELEGGKAKVIRAQRMDNNSFWALKVFKHAYRKAEQEKSVRRLAAIRTLPGLQAAEQYVIRPNDPIAVKEKDLHWAVLMPWVAGDTWGKVLAQVQDGKRTYSRPEADALALKILDVLIRLEREQIVHCDLSGGNLLLQTSGGAAKAATDTQLVDLEDMLIKGQMPSSFTTGSPGYALPGVDKTACPEGDRYAGAILIAEALAIGLPHAKDLASSDGVFRKNRDDLTAHARFQYVYNELMKWQPRFAALLMQAWNARTLRDCAPLNDLMASLSSAGAIVTAPVSPVSTTPKEKPNSARFGTGDTQVAPTSGAANTTSTGQSINRFNSASVISSLSATPPPPPPVTANPFVTPPGGTPPGTTPASGQGSDRFKTSTPSSSGGGGATPPQANPPPATSQGTNPSTSGCAGIIGNILVWGFGLFLFWIVVQFLIAAFSPRGHSAIPRLTPTRSLVVLRPEAIDLFHKWVRPAPHPQPLPPISGGGENRKQTYERGLISTLNPYTALAFTGRSEVVHPRPIALPIRTVDSVELPPALFSEKAHLATGMADNRRAESLSSRKEV